VAGTWAVGAAVYHDDPRAVALLLQAVGAGAGQAERQATDALPDAAASASTDVAAVLLAAGADPNGHDEHGVSALRLAVRAGESETAALLASRGAPDDSTAIDVSSVPVGEQTVRLPSSSSPAIRAFVTA
jgi:ankyrin repeat protein